MRKKLSAIMLAVLTGTVLIFSLTACEDGSVASVVNDGVSEDTPAEEIPEIPLTQGEATVDVGDFTVTVPEGWMGAGDIDVNEKGEYYIEPYYYLVVKGGESEDDAHVKPTVSIYYSSDSDAQSLLELNISPDDKNTDLDITIGGKKCPAYHAVKEYAIEGEDPFGMEYDNVYIPVSDSSCIRVTMLTYDTTDGDKGISASDADVIAIMESLKVN